MTLIDLPVLFKRAADGGVQTWEVRVEPEDDGTATIVTTYGRENGKKQENRDQITAGKNTGKKNETTPQQQAIKEAEAAWAKRKDRKHYGETIRESELKIVAAPMLAHVYDDHASKINWEDKEHLHVQPKFDGHRCLVMCDDAMNITLVSREGKPIETCPHLIDQLHPVMEPGTILDGELYVHGESLNVISSLIKKKRPRSEELCYILYDISNPKLSFKDRNNLLVETLDGLSLSHVHLSRTQPIGSVDEAAQFQAHCLEHDYEGAMLRHGRAGYRPGKRSANLLKMKTFFDGEFVIIGCKEGRSSYTGMAIFQCATEDGNPFDVTAPGSHEEKKAFWENRDSYLGKRMTVKYQMFTNTDAPVPFLPVAKEIADG